MKPSYFIFLRTPRLFLRRFTSDDADLLYKLDADPEVRRYISKGPGLTMEVIQTKILPRWLQYYKESDHMGFWAAHETATEDFVGWFHFRPDRICPEEMELGYRFKRSAWGKGYATEGSRALIEKAFTEWDVGRVVARTLVGNKASQRVMQKAGLYFEETFTYSSDLLPGWTEAERHAVKYGISAEQYARSVHRASKMHL